MFGSKKEEVAGDWRKLHNEELHDTKYCYGDQVRGRDEQDV